MTGKLLTPDEVAARLRRSRAWVTAQARAGELPGIKVGHFWRFEEGDISAWLDRHKNRDPLAPTPLSAKRQGWR